eukprot:9133980-Lingulodinium_polyedra.AAC.1
MALLGALSKGRSGCEQCYCHCPSSVGIATCSRPASFSAGRATGTRYTRCGRCRTIDVMLLRG